VVVDLRTTEAAGEQVGDESVEGAGDDVGHAE